MFIEIIGVIAILMALRAVITKDRAEKLLYINVIGFCVSALIALYIQTPFGKKLVLWQNGPLEWVHLPAQAKKVVASYPGLIATLILKEKSRALDYLVKSHQKL